MKIIFERIPLIVWTLIFAALASYVVIEDYFSFLSINQIRLLSSFFALIGLVFVAIQIQSQKKNQKISTEYLNQPNFKIVGYEKDVIIGGGPVLCLDKKTCNDDHWFDIIQTGNLPAKKVKLCFYHRQEESDIKLKNSQRWDSHEIMIKGQRQQYKLQQFIIPIKYLDKNENGCFFVSLEYYSSYSNIKYKRIYQICYTIVESSSSSTSTGNDWKGMIKYYDCTLVKATDSNSIKLNELIKGKWLKILRFFTTKTEISDDDWIITF